MSWEVCPRTDFLAKLLALFEKAAGRGRCIVAGHTLNSRGINIYIQRASHNNIGRLGVSKNFWHKKGIFWDLVFLHLFFISHEKKRNLRIPYTMNQIVLEMIKFPQKKYMYCRLISYWERSSLYSKVVSASFGSLNCVSWSIKLGKSYVVSSLSESRKKALKPIKSVGSFFCTNTQTNKFCRLCLFFI